MGRHIEALVGRINRIHADRGDAPQRLWVPTHGTLDECAIVALMDRTDTPVVATLMVGINEDETASGGATTNELVTAACVAAG